MKLKKTRCAICGTFNNSTILHVENLPQTGISSAEYAPRRDRDYAHYQIVRCNTCNLARSDPMADSEIIDDLYKESDCTYSAKKENEPLTKTYGRYLEEIVNCHNISKTSFLDIGCSNGFMMEKAENIGFSLVKGVEPSLDAINQALPRFKEKIIPGMFDYTKFQDEQFDLISFFQTFDHIIDPNQFLQDVRNILNDDGHIIAINHNIGSISYKFLKEKSPIIDIGHAYLYDLITMRKIFEKNDFKVIKVFPIKNVVTPSRLLELLPFNQKSKNILSRIQSGLGIGNLQIPLYLGNLGIFAKK